LSSSLIVASVVVVDSQRQKKFPYVCHHGVNLGDTTYDVDLWTPSGTGTAAIYNDDTSEMVT
jgi:hypothetical protein